MKSLLGLVVTILLCLVATSFSRAAEEATPSAVPASQPIDRGDTAWMLMSSGLVLLMVPGLALFYGGMVRRKNVLGTMMHSMAALPIVGIQWLLLGYCLAFGTSLGGWLGWEPRLLGLAGVAADEAFPGTHIPVFVHCIYQGMFAIITPALISGAIAERIRFGPYCLFLLLWTTLVYDPLAHWVWAVDSKGDAAGWLGKLGALDFAGGTVVHISAGLAGLAAVLLLRNRIGFPKHAMHPNSMVLTLVGAGLLWFGWFGFNGGSALAGNSLAGVALAASQVAAAGAALSWLAVEWLHRGKPTALGLASGVVAGLVAVTPASGFVPPLGALAIGLAAGVVCYFAVSIKPALGYDDSLDAFGIHGVGGFLGALLTGVFASRVLYHAGSGGSLPGDSAGGALLDHNWGQLATQALAGAAAIVYSFVVSLVLVKVIDAVWGFCLEPKAENEGLDRCAHGEVGFDFGMASESLPEEPATEPRPASVPPLGPRRFAVIVEGAPTADLIRVWSDLCQAGAVAPPPEFRAVYPYLTTVQGNQFRFRDGRPEELRDNLRQLLQERLPRHAIRAKLQEPNHRVQVKTPDRSPEVAVAAL